MSRHKGRRLTRRTLNRKIPQRQPTPTVKTVASNNSEAQVPEQNQAALTPIQSQALSLAYDSAVSLFESRHYEMAFARFEDIREMDPSYKKTNAYLEKIGKILNKKKAVKPKSKKELLRQKKKELEPVYREGVKLYEQRQYIAARSMFEKVQEIIPNYKETKKYLHDIKQAQYEDVETYLNQTGPFDIAV